VHAHTECVTPSLMGPEPMFTCPFSSTDGNFHSDITQNGVGNNNLFNGVNVPNPSQDLIYSCSINDGLVDCRYYQDVSRPYIA